MNYESKLAKEMFETFQAQREIIRRSSLSEMIYTDIMLKLSLIADAMKSTPENIAELLEVRNMGVALLHR